MNEDPKTMQTSEILMEIVRLGVVHNHLLTFALCRSEEDDARRELLCAELDARIPPPRKLDGLGHAYR